MSEFEFTPGELDELTYKGSQAIRLGIMFWLKEKFKLDLLPKFPAKGEEEKEHVIK